VSDIKGGSKGGGVKDISTLRMQKLAEENRELRRYVADVMKRLRENEQLFARLFELESHVLAATDPEDMCFTLLRGLRTGFSLDMVRLWFDHTSFVGNCQLDGISENDLVWLERGEIEQMGLAGRQVWLIALSEERNFDWLEPRDGHLASIALLVLGNPARPFGVLGLGSIESDRFGPEQGTDFLQHLAQVVGLTLENAVSRERLARLAVTDTLTGTHNRRFLQPHSHQPLSQWFGKGVPVAALYFDIDDFTAINERMGDDFGNDLLTRVVDIARDFVRTQDPLVRMSGDEFVLLVPGCGRDKITEIAEGIVAACGRIEVEGSRLGISMGVTYIDGDRECSVKSLIAEADQAMYVAKALGGSRIEYTGRDGDGD